MTTPTLAPSSAVLPPSDPPRRTPEEIRDLASDWRRDPCWDLECTPGFEAHREELLAVRLAYERECEESWQRKLLDKAEQLGAPGNVALAKYVLALEYRLDEFAKRLDRLES